MKKSSNSFISGALILSLGGLFAKILGALYRIPLTNIIGSYGMGLYQLVFPPYILFLTVAQCGVPVALSKLIAQYNGLGDKVSSHKTFKFSLVLLTVLGTFCAITLTLFANLIAKAQGNEQTTVFFWIVAPALVFVPITNVLKAYFQGNMNMAPSGVTTVIEQLVKLIVGLTLAIKFMPDVNKAVTGAVFAITVSELSSLVIMSIVYAVHKRKNKLQPLMHASGSTNEIAKSIFELAIPAALGGFVMQLSQVIDSVMVVNLLTVNNATQMYGLWTGPVNSMLGLPIALSGGVAVSALPDITKTYYCGDKEKLQQSFNSAIKLTLVIALPCAFGMIALSNPILQLLYRALPQQEIYVASVLLSVSGLSIVFLAVMQTCVSVCQAVGKPYATVVIISLAIVVKAVVNIILLPNPKINIYGAAISETMCYLFATVCVIIYLNKKIGLKLDVAQCVIKPLSAGMFMTMLIVFAIVFAGKVLTSTSGTLLLIALSGCAYLALIMQLKVFDKKQ